MFQRLLDIGQIVAMSFFFYFIYSAVKSKKGGRK